MRRSAAAAAALVVVILAALAGITAISAASGDIDIAGGAFSIGVAFFTFVGALIVWRQPANRIGWLFAAIGILWVTGDLASRYSAYAVESGGGTRVLVWLGAWYGEWYWLLFLMLTFSILPQLFPTGRPMTGRWSGIARGVWLFIWTFVVLAMLEDELHVAGTARVIHNPFGIPGLHDVEEGFLAPILVLGALFSVFTGIAAIGVRLRRSRGVEKQQIKWVAVAVVALIVQFVGQSALLDSGGGERIALLDALALALVPIAAAVAMFRYRLYDIDLVINRALVYGALTAILAGAYLGLVVVLQGALAPVTADSDIAVAASTLAVAALFRPLRARVQGFIDRRFYRHKYDAAETLEEFSARLRDEVDLDSLNRQLVEVVGSTMQPAHASLWLRRGEAS